MNGKKGIVKLFPDLMETVEMLDDAQAGRLLKALLRHVNGEALPDMGAEALVFSMLKTQLDRDSAEYGAFIDKQRQNGMKGGRPAKIQNSELRIQNGGRGDDPFGLSNPSDPSGGTSPANSPWPSSATGGGHGSSFQGRQNPAVIDENPENPTVIDENPENLELDIDIDHDTDIDIDHEGEGDARARAFTPPTEEQVAAYCREKGYALNPAVFVAHYAAVGWVKNGVAIRDWQAKATEWEMRDRESGAPAKRAERRGRALDYAQRRYTDAELNAHLTDLRQFESG